MRRVIIDHDGIDYRHHEERYMRDPELRDAYECGYRKAYKEIMSEQYGGYGERNYGHGVGYNQRDMWREQPPMYREDHHDWDEYEERRRRRANGRFY